MEPTRPTMFTTPVTVVVGAEKFAKPPVTLRLFRSNPADPEEITRELLDVVPVTTTWTTPVLWSNVPLPLPLMETVAGFPFSSVILAEMLEPPMLPKALGMNWYFLGEFT